MIVTLSLHLLWARAVESKWLAAGKASIPFIISILCRREISRKKLQKIVVNFVEAGWRGGSSESRIFGFSYFELQLFSPKIQLSNNPTSNFQKDPGAASET
jgi:hypothetical protein